MKQLGKVFYLIFCVCVSMIGYRMHHDFIFAILDFFFAPIALIYWLITHQINITIIKTTFEFFLK